MAEFSALQRRLHKSHVTATVCEIASSCQHKMCRANTAKDKPETTMTRFFITGVAALLLATGTAHTEIINERDFDCGLPSMLPFPTTAKGLFPVPMWLSDMISRLINCGSMASIVRFQSGRAGRCTDEKTIPNRYRCAVLGNGDSARIYAPLMASVRQISNYKCVAINRTISGRSLVDSAGPRQIFYGEE
jgi:hypothetical protein